MKATLRNAALISLLSLGLASAAQASIPQKVREHFETASVPTQVREHMLTADGSVGTEDQRIQFTIGAVSEQGRNHMLTAAIPQQLRDHLLTASANVIGPSDGQYGIRNLQVSLPGQVVDHLLTASASPEANGYTGLIQQA
ncbi:hypothetical protein [Leptolyngbya sp. FACHB-261]|uniref:hypothetical protein n=1 Tax=Leptolyngbya sp. FACHB-261 TaxID=2692806 RepID=UPI0016877F92|nr:hypothetical protein [Leptolyngbya sp. FACHB-261]MBD2100187.1 hypothetical protein [Leptolyngbya sp. FACHB-261]